MRGVDPVRVPTLSIICTYPAFVHKIQSRRPQSSDKSQSHTELKIGWNSSSNVRLTFSSLTVLFTALWRQKTESA